MIGLGGEGVTKRSEGSPRGFEPRSLTARWKTGSHEFGDIFARILRGFGEFTFEDSGRKTFQHVALRLGVEP
jgi:hypothetical protein